MAAVKTIAAMTKEIAVDIGSPERPFPVSLEMVNNRRVPVYRLTCSTCGCNTPPVISRDGSTLTTRRAKAAFMTKRWNVGETKSDDLCPSCRERQAQAKALADMEQRRIQREEDEITWQEHMIEANEKIKEWNLADQKQSGGKYRPITVADRRIIIQKLTEVYQDEARGYKAPWTDMKVATDLGCSKDWVAKIREENFGAVPDFPDLRDITEQSAKNQEAIEEIGARVTDLNRQLAALREKVNGDSKVVEQVRKAVA